MAGAHLGSKNIDFQMKKYVFKTKNDGTRIFNLHQTWEKMVLAARVIVAIENPKDVAAISGRAFGSRAVLKFCSHTGAQPYAGRYTPGTFTNQIQKAYAEPRVLVVTDPRQDHQPIREASYANIPVIALCNSDTPCRYIDIAIPCNNSGVQSIGLMWWFLAREVLRFRGTISRGDQWDIMPDLYFYRDPEEVEKEELARLEDAAAVAAPANNYDQWDAAEAAPAPAATAGPGDWSADAAPAAPASGTEEWAASAGDQWAAPTANWDASK